MLAGKRNEKLRSALGLLVAHPGNGLVEQQQTRLLHQQHSDLEPLLLSVRQQPGNPVVLSLRRISFSISPMRSCLRRKFCEQGPAYSFVCFHRQLEVFEHRVPFEDRRLLKLASDTGVCDLRLRQLGQVDRLAEERGTGVGARLARDDIHHCGLARAVGPDHAAQLAGIDRQRQIVQRAKAVEADADALEIKDDSMCEASNPSAGDAAEV